MDELFGELCNTFLQPPEAVGLPMSTGVVPCPSASPQGMTHPATGTAPALGHVLPALPQAGSLPGPVAQPGQGSTGSHSAFGFSNFSLFQRAPAGHPQPALPAGTDGAGKTTKPQTGRRRRGVGGGSPAPNVGQRTLEEWDKPDDKPATKRIGRPPEDVLSKSMRTLEEWETATMETICFFGDAFKTHKRYLKRLSDDLDTASRQERDLVSRYPELLKAKKGIDTIISICTYLSSASIGTPGFAKVYDQEQHRCSLAPVTEWKPPACLCRRRYRLRFTELESVDSPVGQFWELLRASALTT